MPRAVARLQESYRIILNARNHLHLISKYKNDRLEFIYQEKLQMFLGYSGGEWHAYMRKFRCSEYHKKIYQHNDKTFQKNLHHLSATSINPS